MIISTPPAKIVQQQITTILKTAEKFDALGCVPLGGVPLGGAAGFENSERGAAASKVSDVVGSCTRSTFDRERHSAFTLLLLLSEL